jgi:hypothetical protein
MPCRESRNGALEAEAVLQSERVGSPDLSEEETDEEVPAWLWDEEQAALPVRELQLTEEGVVVQVYALARCHLPSHSRSHSLVGLSIAATAFPVSRHNHT